jgi:hypothetical protein
LYSAKPDLNLNSIASLKKQAIAKYTEKCIKERNDRYGDNLIAQATVSKHSKLGVSNELIRQIVDEEQDLIDSGIDIAKAMAMTHQEDRLRYRSAREKFAERKHKTAQEKVQQIYGKQASSRAMGAGLR